MLERERWEELKKLAGRPYSHVQFEGQKPGYEICPVTDGVAYVFAPNGGKVGEIHTVNGRTEVKATAW